MFAENNRLSIPQVKRMFLIEVFSTFSLTMPAIVTKEAGYYGIYPLLIGSLLAGVYLLFLLVVGKKVGGNYGDYLREQFGKGIQTVMILLYLLRFLIKSAYTALIFITLIQMNLLKGQGKIQILLPFLLLCGFVAYEGMETRGRILELLAFFIFVPLLVTVFLSLTEVSMVEWLPKGTFSWEKIVRTSGFVFLTYSPMEFVLFYGGNVSMSEEMKKQGNQVGRAVGKGYALAVVFHVVLFLTTIGLFGVQMTKDSMFPAFAIMETAKLPADFISRLDILLIAFWVFSMFGVMSGYSTYGMWLVKDMVKGKKKGIILTVFLLLSGGLTLLFGNLATATDWFFRYLMWIDVPIGVFIPLLVLLKKKRRRI